MSRITLSDLKLGARELADMVNSAFISDVEEKRIINLSWAKLYDIILHQHQNEFVNEATINVNYLQPEYDLPIDFYKIRSVDRVISLNQFVPVDRMMFNNRRAYQTGPNDSFKCKIAYYPEPSVLENDTDEIDVIPLGQDFIMIDAAIKYLNKEESSVTHLVRERKLLKDEIIENSTRDAFRPKKIHELKDYTSYNTIFYSGTRYDIVNKKIVFMSVEMGHE